MTCCKCARAIDTKDRDIPPTWFGTYVAGDIIKVICAECISDPGNGTWWED